MRRDVQEIFRNTPHEKQVMMFSATLSKEIRPVCKKFMQDVILLSITLFYFYYYSCYCCLMRKHRLFLLPKSSPTVKCRNPNTFAVPYQHSLASVRGFITSAELALVLLLSVPSITAALTLKLLAKVILVRELYPTYCVVNPQVTTEVR